MTHRPPARTDPARPLRIGLLGYRSNPHCGGQGVYIKNLSKALTDLGHRVEVISGPPAPHLDPRVRLTYLPGLDLYNPADLFRTPSLRELADPVNLLEWLGVSSMGFPEPLTFGIRAFIHLRRRASDYDILHDNQSLSYGVQMLGKKIPTVATIHHPITVDRDLAVRAAPNLWKKFKQRRWYSFIGMQIRVARKLSRIITVSDHTRKDISDAFSIPRRRISVVPNGIDTALFRPLPEIRKDPHRVIVTTSADTPLKGLPYLLRSVARIAAHREIRLIVVGSPKENGYIARLVRELNIGNVVRFTGRISGDSFVRHYARASVAVVPSVYEGFGLPAGEAMACGVPVVTTSGGALPEVVGDAGLVVPPRDPDALAHAIVRLLNDPAEAMRRGEAGYRRVQEHFSWEQAARKTVQIYRETLHDHHQRQTPEP